MVSVLRIVATVIAVACLSTAGLWFAADRYAGSVVLEDLRDRGMDRHFEIAEIRIPKPGVIRISDARLRDPDTGEVVAQVDEVEILLEFGSHGGWGPIAPALIRGRGGRIVLSVDDGDLGLVRLCKQLVVLHNEWATRQVDYVDKRAPPIEVRDVDIVLRSAGLPLETLSGCTVWVNDMDVGSQIIIENGSRGGILTLWLGPAGLRSLKVSGFAVSPEYAMFLPGKSGKLAEEFRPRGILDFELHRGLDEELEASGVLREAVLTPKLVPFPLERVNLPFEYKDRRFSIKEARIGFEGGELETSIEHTAESLTVALDVVDASFRKDYLQLFPQVRELTWIRCEDGGNIELHLVVEQRGDAEGLSVRGWGGVLVDRVWLGPRLVEVEDLVGSFDIRDNELIFRETSGVCASGVVQLRGLLNIESGELEFDVSVQDVELARVHRAMGMPEPDWRGGIGITGWLQGDLQYRGRLGAPEEGRGEGQLSVRGGNLWKVPVLSAVLTALGLERPGPSEAHRLSMRFRVRGEGYRIDEARLESSYLSLIGNGRVRGNGEIDMDIIPLSVPLGPLGKLLEFVQRQIVKVELGGTVGDPQVKVIPLKVVTGPIGSFFGWVGSLFNSDPEPETPSAP
jgi:hypothetical protein